MASILDKVFTRQISAHIYGLAAALLGLEGLVWGDYAVVWNPVPDSAPGQNTLGFAAAVPFLLAGLAMLWHRSAKLGALALTSLFSLGVIFLDVPRVLAHPAVFLSWYGVAEPLALAAAGLVAYASCAQFEIANAERLARIGRFIFGACLIVFGLAHFFYLAYTAKMVPGWLPPGQVFWAYVRGAGHFAAGIAILAGTAARLAAISLTAMFVVFGILVHAPTIVIDPHRHFYWAENTVNFCLIGSAWVMAGSRTACRTGSLHKSQSLP